MRFVTFFLIVLFASVFILLAWLGSKFKDNFLVKMIKGILKEILGGFRGN